MVLTAAYILLFICLSSSPTMQGPQHQGCFASFICEFLTVASKVHTWLSTFVIEICKISIFVKQKDGKKNSRKDEIKLETIFLIHDFGYV